MTVRYLDGSIHIPHPDVSQMCPSILLGPRFENRAAIEEMARRLQDAEDRHQQIQIEKEAGKSIVLQLCRSIWTHLDTVYKTFSDFLFGNMFAGWLAGWLQSSRQTVWKRICVEQVETAVRASGLTEWKTTAEFKVLISNCHNIAITL